MNEYSIHTADGKTLGSSVFFLIAHDSLGKECQRLEDFTITLDREPAKKRKCIAEYKCAKYRYASVSHAHNLLYHGYRVYRMSEAHKHVDIENVIQNNHELLQICNSAVHHEEKIECKLYYGISIIVQEQMKMYTKKMETASDWEKIELEERLGGLEFAKFCLDEAWQKRKDVIE